MTSKTKKTRTKRTKKTRTKKTKTIDRPSCFGLSQVVDPSGWLALGLGSNLGSRRSLLRWALAELCRELGELAVAPPYRTRPISSIAQPDFLNTVAIARRPAGDDPSPRQVLAFAKRLEQQAGRSAGPRDGPRPLDIDLLFYGDRVLDEPSRRTASEAAGGGPLVVPHPRLRSRLFVLAPLGDLAQDLRLPPDGARVGDLLAGLDGQQVERLPWNL